MGKYRIDGEIYEADTPEEAYRKHDEYSKLSGIQGAAQQFNQGLTLGGADELTAGLEAVTGGNYSESMKRQKAQRERYQREHPWISGAATAAGAIAPVAASLLLAPETGGASTVAAGGRALQLARAAFGGGGRSARTVMEGVKEGARVGVPLGAMNGYLSADPGSRGSGTVMGAAGGGAIGGAAGGAGVLLPRAAEAVGRGMDRVRASFPSASSAQVARAPAPSVTPTPSAADARVLRAMEASNVTPEGAAVEIERSRQLGVPLGILDVGGTQTQRLGRSVRTLPGEGSHIVENALAQRGAGQRDRVVNFLERSLGTRATGNGEAVIDNLWEQSRARSGPYYQQLENLPEITDPAVSDYFRLPAVRGIVQDAENAATAWGRPRVPMYQEGGDLARNPRFTDVDLVNQNINEMSRPAYSVNPRPVPGAPIATRAERAMANDVRRDLVGAADAAPGGDIYNRARTSYAGPAEARNYYEEGLKFPSATQQDVTATLADATAPQRKWYRRGQIEALRSGVDSMADLSSQPNRLRSFWNSIEDRSKLTASVPDVGTRRADLEGRMAMENQAAHTSNFVRSGSQSIDKAAEAVDTLSPDTVLEAASSPVRATAKALWNNISGAMGKETRAQVARHLTSFNDPNQSIAYLRRLQELQAQGRLTAQAIDAAAAATVNAN